MLNQQEYQDRLASGDQEAASNLYTDLQVAQENLQEETGFFSDPTEIRLFFDRLKEINEPIIDQYYADSESRFSNVLAHFLNGMEDITGDSLLRPFLPQELAAFSSSLSSFKEESEVGNEDEVRVVEAWRVAWMSLFPRPFMVTTPPPGSIQKLSSIILGPSPVFPNPTRLFNMTGEEDPDQWYQILAEEFFRATSTLTHTVTYLVSTPTGPIPGPPIIAPVR